MNLLLLFIFIPFFIILPCHVNAHGILTIPAIRRTAELGDIYDAKSNTFSNTKLFQRPGKVLNLFTKTIDNANTNSKFSFASKESERLEDLSINGELKLQIMCNAITTNGATNFAKSPYSQNKTVEVNYIVQIETQKEFLSWQLASDFLKIHDVQGTHVVIGIQYGVNGIVTLSQMYDETTSSEEIKGTLKGIFAKAINGTTAYSTSEKLTEKSHRFTIQVEADIFISVKTITDAQNFAENLHSQLTSSKNQKGVQIAFELLPLTTVFKHLKISPPHAVNYEPLAPAYIAMFDEKLNTLDDMAESFYDHYLNAMEHKTFMTHNDKKFYIKMKPIVEGIIGKIHKDMSLTIIKLHDEKICINAKKKMEEDETDLNEIIKDFNRITEEFLIKVDFIKNAETRGFKYISNKRDLENFKRKHGTVILVFLTNENFKEFQGRFMLIEKINIVDGYGLVHIENLSHGEEIDFSKNYQHHLLFFYHHETYYKMVIEADDEDWVIYPVYATQNIGVNLIDLRTKVIFNSHVVIKAGTQFPIKNEFIFERSSTYEPFIFQVFYGKNVLGNLNVEPLENEGLDCSMEVTHYGILAFKVKYNSNGHAREFVSGFMLRKLKKNLLLN